MLQVLKSFSMAFGHMVSKDKTSIYFSKNTDHKVALNITRRLEFNQMVNQEKYLGVPYSKEIFLHFG